MLTCFLHTNLIKRKKPNLFTLIMKFRNMPRVLYNSIVINVMMPRVYTVVVEN